MSRTSEEIDSSRASAPALVADPSTALPRHRIGEELPIFCEQCGYSFSGLPISRCAHCTILQFQCPECGHHQPINTLRPAFQRILGRLRAAWLAGVVVFKLNVLGWPLIGWVGMGMEWSFRFLYSGGGQRIVVPAIVSLEMLLTFLLFALGYGAVGRMMLLRWKGHWQVGLVLSLLVVAAVSLGAQITAWDRHMAESPFTAEIMGLMGLTALCVIIGAWIVWPIWVLLVNAFLPRHVARALLEWQQFRPAPALALARE